MPSNVENILNGILSGDGSGIQKPASRVEELLYAIYQNGGGGGGGTSTVGVHTVANLRFISAGSAAEITDEDVDSWNNKVTASIDPEDPENIVISH